MFLNSAFTQTLCWPLAFSSSTGSNGRFGCCLPGTFMAYPNLNQFSKSAACEACPVGQYGSTVDDDITSCNDCGTGKYNNLIGQSSESIACQNCGTGKYNEQVGQSLCQNCSAGKYNEQVGQSLESIACQNCSTGKYNDQVGQSSESIGCKHCGIGRYSNETTSGSDSVCKSCTTGQYNDKLSANSCTHCPNGQYTPQLAATSITQCNACEPGRTLISDDPLVCQTCEAGYYLSEIPLSTDITCIACSQGQYIADTATDRLKHDSRADCVACPIGRQFTSVAVCDVCAGGKFQSTSTTDAKPCTSCSAGQFIADNGDDFTYHDSIKDCLFCSPGKHSSLGAAFCDRCPAGYQSFENQTSNETKCMPCKSGRYQAQAGQNQCNNCSSRTPT